ncbi:MAG TPA: hypothetical protein VE442_23295 [Jatrophihabitans sp.]|nr:hypothetical protein [Jatrophihabitans sp.]
MPAAALLAGDRLRAGEALEHVWLRLTDRGVSASPLTKVAEVQQTHERLRADLALGADAVTGDGLVAEEGDQTCAGDGPQVGHVVRESDLSTISRSNTPCIVGPAGLEPATYGLKEWPSAAT